MNEQRKPEQEETEVNYSFGQRLSSARRALSLTQEQVAAELRLSTGLIKALEDEDYSKLPSGIYVAGYLRNYARLLKVPVEPMLIALNKSQPESPPLISDASRPRKASHTRLVVKLFTLVLLIIIVTGLVSWIQSQDFTLFSGKLDEAEQSEAPVLKALPDMLPEKVIDDSIAPATEEQAIEVESIPVPVPESTEPAISPISKEDAKTEAVAIPEVTGQTNQIDTINDGVELVLKFSGDCWAEVKDGRGQTLLHELVHDGQKRQLTGVPPYRIILGNAPVVTIEYNGKPYDASTHIRGKLARFNLGKVDDYKSKVE